MRHPIKLNAKTFGLVGLKLPTLTVDPRGLLDPGISSERFSAAVSALKFLRTFKTTKANRFPESTALLANLEFETAPKILDVGASDGIASLQLLDAFPSLQTLYITDLNWFAEWCVVKGWWLCRDKNGSIILAVNDFLVIYADCDCANWLVRWIVNKCFLLLKPAEGAAWEPVRLLNPAVAKKLGNTVVTKAYNALDEWPDPKVDVIVAANLLNSSYFTGREVCICLRNFRKALQTPGYLCIIDNREDERSSLIYVRGQSAELVGRIRSGAECEELALKVLNGKSQDDEIWPVSGSSCL